MAIQAQQKAALEARIQGAIETGRFDPQQALIGFMQQKERCESYFRNGYSGYSEELMTAYNEALMKLQNRFNMTIGKNYCD